MNIILFSFPRHQAFTGKTRYLLSLFSALAPRDIASVVFGNDAALMRAWKEHGWKRKRLPRMLAMMSAFPFLLWVRMRHHARVLFCIHRFEKIFMTLPARCIGMRVLWLEYQSPERWGRWNPLFLMERILAHSAIIIGVSWTTKRHLTLAGFPEKRIYVIPPGVPEQQSWQPSIFTTIATKKQPRFWKSRFCVGMVARLTKEKGIEYLLQAIRLSTEAIPDIQCIIVGHGPERNALQWLSGRLGLNKRVLFVGWQTHPQKWMEHFDCLVLPSIQRESFGYAPLEAMTLGKPIIATNIGGITEIVESTKTGMLVPPKNPEMLAEAIITLSLHPEWREAMGVRARARVAERFSIQQMADTFEKLVHTS